MAAQSRLVGLKQVAAEHFAMSLGCEASGRWRSPPVARLFKIQVRWVAVGVAGRHHGLEHRPDPIEFPRLDLPDDQRVAHEASAIVSPSSFRRPRSELVMASVIITSMNWPIMRLWPGKFT